ncbi:MAG TPA: chlorite dismutase family protein [Steroidobacteraceae bacterium]|nr:chlorite dismutase family protein [Steroidobacteraceae bacterium]
MPSPLLVTFTAGTSGSWRIDRMSAVIGEGLPLARRLSMYEHPSIPTGDPVAWTLRGTTSNTRYTNHDEVTRLTARQESLQRPQATRAALIPIRKSEAWWSLAQDERREIFEEQSRHIAIGMDYLPAIARRLHHCRELGEPFDFLTWFEYASADADKFEGLVRRLRATREWQFVDREVDIRLSRI